MYHHEKIKEHKEKGFTANQTTGSQMFTLYPTNPKFGLSTEVPLGSGLFAQSYCKLTNGKSITVQTGIPQDDPWEN